MENDSDPTPLLGLESDPSAMLGLVLLIMAGVLVLGAGVLVWLIAT